MMAGVMWGREVRIRVPCAGVLALCALALGLGSAPALADCPSLDNVALYSGTVELIYEGGKSQPVSDGNGGTETLSISHSGTGITAAAMTPDAAGLDFTGDASGGMVGVADGYRDENQGVITIGGQTASGGADGGEISISFDASSCTYTVEASYTAPTTGEGTWHGAADGKVADEAVSPAMPIPANLKLSGHVQVRAYPVGSPDLAGVEAGYYDFGAGTSWATELARISGVDPSTGDIGPGEFSWSLTPSMQVKQKFCLVPGVAGTPLASAETAITSAKCAVGPITEQPSEVVPTGDVISSDPADGTVQPVGTKVALVVSSGPQCTVPAVAGQLLAAAKTALVGAHCAVGKITKQTSATVAKGKVISSAPGAGTTHPAGTQVALTVSKGKKPRKKKCVVPAVKGETVTAARAALTSAHCAVGAITLKVSSTVPKGRVISSAPPAGTAGPAGMKVALTVSGEKKTKCVVPVLRGKKLAAAKTALKRAHCAVGKVTKKASAKIAAGKVISSNPKAGTTHKAGTKVALKVSKGVPKTGKQCMVPAVAGTSVAGYGVRLAFNNCSTVIGNQRPFMPD